MENSSYNIYFDESNKIDSPGKLYSYYGAFGISQDSKLRIEAEIKVVFANLKTNSEIHLNDYQSSSLKKYFQVLDIVEM
ncbi:MAG: hypothetical protein ACK5MW_04215 [Enterococcus sp.]